MSRKVTATTPQDVLEINRKIEDIILKFRGTNDAWSSICIVITYNLGVYYYTRKSVGHAKNYFDCDHMPFTKTEAKQRYGRKYLDIYVDNDFIIGQLKYYEAPRCKDSWIFGAMTYIKYNLSDLNKYSISFRPGSILFEYADNTTNYVVEISKNAIKILGYFDDSTVYIDFTKGFLLHYHYGSPEDLGTTSITSLNMDDGAAKKLRYAYMDAIYPRVFIGFEDVNVVLQNDQ